MVQTIQRITESFEWFGFNSEPIQTDLARFSWKEPTQKIYSLVNQSPLVQIPNSSQKNMSIYDFTFEVLWGKMFR